MKHPLERLLKKLVPCASNQMRRPSPRSCPSHARWRSTPSSCPRSRCRRRLPSSAHRRSWTGAAPCASAPPASPSFARRPHRSSRRPDGAARFSSVGSRRQSAISRFVSSLSCGRSFSTVVLNRCIRASPFGRRRHRRSCASVARLRFAVTQIMIASFMTMSLSFSRKPHCPSPLKNATAHENLQRKMWTRTIR